MTTLALSRWGQCRGGGAGRGGEIPVHFAFPSSVREHGIRNASHRSHAAAMFSTPPATINSRGRPRKSPCLEN